MNCKPGDLALIVRSKAGNEGRLVECLELVGVVYDRFGMLACNGLVCWRVRALDGRPIKWDGGYVGEFVADARMRPIRDNDGEDETLSWAGNPQHVEA